MSVPRPTAEVLGYYALGGERGRLEEAYFPLERARTQELVTRHLPSPPGVVLDVGGAAGAYAFWLAERGYDVHLVDPVPLHVEQADEASRSRADGRLPSARVGDARRLEFADEAADAVLLLGPLYHLTERGDRLAGLFAVEGPGALLPDFRKRWDDPASRARLLDLVRRVEREPALLGVSPHLLAVGRR